MISRKKAAFVSSEVKAAHRIYPIVGTSLACNCYYKSRGHVANLQSTSIKTIQLSASHGFQFQSDLSPAYKLRVNKQVRDK